MVRIFTFVGLCAGTYVGVKALDNLVVWMAERREANMDNLRLEREAKQLKQQLLKEILEKQATIPLEVVEKHHVHSDKDFKLLYKHLKPQNKDGKHKLSSQYQEQRDNTKLLSSHQENKKLVSIQPENCPGEVIAECLECGETFEIVEPVPHSPLEGRQRK